MGTRMKVWNVYNHTSNKAYQTCGRVLKYYLEIYLSLYTNWSEISKGRLNIKLEVRNFVGRKHAEFKMDIHQQK